MNILITGSNGQLGNELQILQKEYSNHKWFNTDVEQLDITNHTAVKRFINTNNIDGIVNCAAFTNVDKAETEIELCKHLNEDAPAFLAEAVSERGGFMIQISTDYVFNGTNHVPYVETDSTCPHSIYGETKLKGEENVKSLCTKSVVIRTAWLYSSFGNNFVKTMIRLGGERERLGVIFDQIGTPTYARDLASAVMTIIDKGIVPGTFHFSNEGVASWYDFTKAIHRLARINGCVVEPILTSDYPTPAERPHFSVLNKTKIKQTYGIDIPHWEASLARCIAVIERNNEQK